MKVSKKIAQILALIFLALPLVSCKEGCVEADQFDSETIIIEAKPTPDKIHGSYPNEEIDWNETSLKSNGKAILIQISGSWSTFGNNNNNMSQADFNAMPICNVCTKNPDIADITTNCICRSDQTPQAEIDISGMPYTLAADGVTPLDCANNPTHQDDALRCTCTKQHGKVTDYGLYHFPLDVLDKNEVVKTADRQNRCRYNQGMGANIAFWGSRGITDPIRIYHLFSEEKVCNVPLNAQGQCVNSEGEDMTRYVFRSANGLTLMRDDNDGNKSIDPNTGNDLYHGPNERLKTKMNDQYYSDNIGQYNLEIFGGFGSAVEPGLIQFLVGMVEDVLLGKELDDGRREGGVIRAMYQAIVQDTHFAQFVQVCLILYITIFGAAHLWGLTAMDKKELLSRVIKISLIMLFISPSSWYFYDEFIVRFFKDGMDYLIGIILSLNDQTIDSTSAIKIAQVIADSGDSSTSALRFAYPDLIIRNLMSEAVAKKIVSLFFADIFGWFYIIFIYLIIFLFIAAMIWVATIYIQNLIKVLFVLAIGPIFIVFSLFKQTASYFENWLSYIAGRCFEMLILFMVINLFLIIIDKTFVEMLLYRACAEKWGIGPLKMIILKAQIDRSLGSWLIYFVTIPGLLWVMLQVIEKAPEVAGKLFDLKIGKDSTSGGFGSDADPENRGGYSGGSVAGGVLGGAAALAKAGAETLGTRILSPVAGGVISGMASLYRGSGLASAYDSVTGGGLAGYYRNSDMNKEWNAALEKHRGNEGAARQAFMESIREKNRKAPAFMASMGINERSASAFLDKKLVQDPLKGFLKDEAKRMKGLLGSQVPVGEEATAKYLSERANEWAKKNLSESGQRRVAELLNDKGIKNLMRDHGALSASEAASAFVGNQEKQNQFRDYLAKKEAESKEKDDKAKKLGHLAGFGRNAAKYFNYAKHGVVGDPLNNPKSMQSSFERALDKEKNPKLWYKQNPFRTDFMEKHGVGFTKTSAKIDKMTKDARLGAMRRYLSENQTQIDTAGMERPDRKQAEKANRRHEFFRDELRKAGERSAGSAPDNKKREEMLRNFAVNDGRSMFEKAAALSQLNKNLGLDEKNDPQTRLAEMMRKEAKLAAARSKVGNKEAEETLNKFSKGLFGSEVDPELARKFVEEESKRGDLTPSISPTNKEIDAKIDEQQLEIQKYVASVAEWKKDLESSPPIILPDPAMIKAEGEKNSGDIDAAKTTLQTAAQELVSANPGVLPVGVTLEDMFGSGANGLLPKAGSIIPEASVMFPNGVTPEGVKGMSETELSGLKMTLNHAQVQVKLAKMALKNAEYDLDLLKANGTSKISDIREKEAKVMELQRELSNEERIFGSIEKTVLENQAK